jgi:hypothetical protein
VPNNVLELLPTLDENQIVDVATQGLGATLPAHKKFQDSEPVPDRNASGIALNEIVTTNPASPVPSASHVQPPPVRYRKKANQVEIKGKPDLGLPDIRELVQTAQQSQLQVSSLQSCDSPSKPMQGSSRPKQQRTLASTGTASALSGLVDTHMHSHLAAQRTDNVTSPPPDEPEETLKLGSLRSSQMMTKWREYLWKMEGIGIDEQPPALKRTTLASLPAGLRPLDADKTERNGSAGSQEQGNFESLVDDDMPARFSRVVPKLRPTAAVSAGSTEMLAMTTKRLVRRPAAQPPPFSVDVNDEDPRIRHEPSSGTRLSATALTSHKQMNTVPNNQETSRTHSIMRKSASGNERVRVRDRTEGSEGTVGVTVKRADDKPSDRARDASLLSRISSHIPTSAALHGTSPLEVVVEIDARDVKQPAGPRSRVIYSPSTASAALSATATAQSIAEISHDLGPPPPFDDEDLELAMAYEAKRREEKAAARSAPGRDKGQRPSSITVTASSPETPSHGGFLGLKPATTSSRLRVPVSKSQASQEELPQEITREEMPSTVVGNAGRGIANASERKNGRSNYAQV